MSKTFQPAFEKVILEKIRFSLVKTLPLSKDQINIWFDQLMIHIDVELFGKKEIIYHNTETLELENVPITWWQFFKFSVFPKWLQKYFPPKLRIIKVTRKIEIIENRVCPHIKIPKNEHEMCLRFLVPGEFRDDKSLLNHIDSIDK